MIARRAKAFGAFAYDFVIGDDWVVAAGVLVTLGLMYGLAHDGHPAPGGSSSSRQQGFCHSVSGELFAGADPVRAELKPYL